MAETIEKVEAIEQAPVLDDYETERGKPMPIKLHSLLSKRLAFILDHKLQGRFEAFPELILVALNGQPFVPDIAAPHLPVFKNKFSHKMCLVSSLFVFCRRLTTYLLFYLKTLQHDQANYRRIGKRRNPVFVAVPVLVYAGRTSVGIQVHRQPGKNT